MSLSYLQVKAGTELPEISWLRLFRTVVVVEENVTPEWQAKVSLWLVDAGCLYMMAWGLACSTWDDSVDFANIEKYKFGEIPENEFVMTTWHENEALGEVFWYSKNNATSPTLEIENSLILHISNLNKEEEFLSKYESA
jgi:hypothetical protein